MEDLVGEFDRIADANGSQCPLDLSTRSPAHRGSRVSQTIDQGCHPREGNDNQDSVMRGLCMAVRKGVAGWIGMRRFDPRQPSRVSRGNFEGALRTAPRKDRGQMPGGVRRVVRLLVVNAMRSVLWPDALSIRGMGLAYNHPEVISVTQAD